MKYLLLEMQEMLGKHYDMADNFWVGAVWMDTKDFYYNLTIILSIFMRNGRRDRIGGKAEQLFLEDSTRAVPSIATDASNDTHFFDSPLVSCVAST